MQQRPCQKCPPSLSLLAAKESERSTWGERTRGRGDGPLVRYKVASNSPARRPTLFSQSERWHKAIKILQLPLSANSPLGSVWRLRREPRAGRRDTQHSSRKRVSSGARPPLVSASRKRVGRAGKTSQTQALLQSLEEGLKSGLFFLLPFFSQPRWSSFSLSSPQLH